MTLTAARTSRTPRTTFRSSWLRPRHVTPARIDLSFRLLRADGTVRGEGERQLRGTGYPVGVGIGPGDPLLYEKVLLDDWLRTGLPRSR